MRNYIKRLVLNTFDDTYKTGDDDKLSEMNASLQSPNWTPIYSQEILFSEDQLKNNITHPKNVKLTDEKIARSGKLNSIDINYFDRENEAMKHLKKRFPFFY